MAKRTNSAFIGTDLESVLRASEIGTLVIAGVITNNSVESTVRMSGNLGFNTDHQIFTDLGGLSIETLGMVVEGQPEVKPGAQATAQSERTKPVLVANRFHAVSQASMMSAKLRNTELASQWLRR